MGQQQLLLIVLSTIIVGVAVVVGIQIFSSSAVNANIDAVTNDCATIVSRAQEWYRKPAALAGGGQAFTGVDALDGGTGIYTQVGFPQTNENGTYTITVPDPDTLQVVGQGVEDGDGDGALVTVTMRASAYQITSTAVTD